MEALLAHTPGLDVFMPSNATDAAGLLNAAFESGRPTIYLYPKVCLNDRDHLAPTDAPGRVAPHRQGPLPLAAQISNPGYVGRNRSYLH